MRYCLYDFVYYHLRFAKNGIVIKINLKQIKHGIIFNHVKNFKMFLKYMMPLIDVDKDIQMQQSK